MRLAHANRNDGVGAMADEVHAAIAVVVPGQLLGQVQLVEPVDPRVLGAVGRLAGDVADGDQLEALVAQLAGVVAGDEQGAVVGLVLVLHHAHRALVGQADAAGAVALGVALRRGDGQGAGLERVVITTQLLGAGVGPQFIHCRLCSYRAQQHQSGCTQQAARPSLHRNAVLTFESHVSP